MNKPFTLTRFLAFLLIILSASCKKNDTPSNQPTKTDHLTSAAWKFDKATSGGTDISAFIQTCYKDNVMTFASAGSGVLDEGATKCNSSDPQTVSFTWSFSSNETVLTVNAAIIAGQSGNFTIITLNGTQLVLEGTVSSPSGNVTGQIYFKH